MDGLQWKTPQKKDIFLWGPPLFLETSIYQHSFIPAVTKKGILNSTGKQFLIPSPTLSM